MQFVFFYYIHGIIIRNICLRNVTEGAIINMYGKRDYRVNGKTPDGEVIDEG